MKPHDIIAEEAKRLFADSFYDEQQLYEIGEGGHEPYPWRQTRQDSHNYDYEFQTPDGDDYEVVAMDIGSYWNIDFKTKTGHFEDVVNKGRFFGVMATVADVIKDFMSKVQPELIRISPAKNSNADRRRLNIYMQFLKKQLPQNYQVTTRGGYIYVQPGEVMQYFEEGYNDDKGVIKLYHRIGTKNYSIETLPDLIKSVQEQGLVTNDNGEVGDALWFSDNYKDYGENGIFVVALDFDTASNGVANNKYGIVYDGHNAYAYENIGFEDLEVVKIPVGTIRDNHVVTNIDAIKYINADGFLTPERVAGGEIDFRPYEDVFNTYVQPYINTPDFLSKTKGIAEGTGDAYAKNRVVDIDEAVREEVMNLFGFPSGVEEGVGDKYAEKQWGIPDADNQYQDMGVPDADMGERIADVWGWNWNDGEKTNYGPVYKNPRTLRGFDADVRAIALDDGDLYVAARNGDFIHTDMELALEKVEGPLGEYYEFHRVGTTNEFGASDTLIHKIQDYALDMRGMIDELNTRHPNFEFSDKYYEYLRNAIEENKDMGFNESKTMRLKEIISEELNKLFENLQTYTIHDLAQMLMRLPDMVNSTVEIIEKMLYREYQKGGDQAVINIYQHFAGVEIEALRPGRYVFDTLTGGGRTYNYGNAGNRNQYLVEDGLGDDFVLIKTSKTSKDSHELNEASNDLGGSLWGLIKYNGGYFKSDKQRDFFLGKLEKLNRDAERAGHGPVGALMSGGEMYGNSYMNFFYLDNEGVTKVEKQTNASGTKVTWERSEENTTNSRKAVLNTAFYKAIQKYIEGVTEQFKQRLQEVRDEIKRIYPDVDSSGFLDLVQQEASRGVLDKMISTYEGVLAGNANPVVEGLLKGVVMVGEMLKQAIADGLIQPNGRTWDNKHPEFHDLSDELSGSEWGKLLPQWQTPEAKQEFIDKMAGNNDHRPNEMPS